MARSNHSDNAARIQPGDFTTLVASVAGYLVTWAVVWKAAEKFDVVREILVTVEQLPTLLQVIPAAIVAVFVFAAGTLLVIAQMVQTTLGSRAVLFLLGDKYARRGVLPGMILLVLSLFLAAINIQAPGPTTWRVQPPTADVPNVWRVSAQEIPVYLASAAVALSLATIAYVIVAVVALIKVMWTFIDPDRYSKKLSEKINGRGQAACNNAYWRVRALRQWLRTAAAAGESRDLAFALIGLERLLCTYRKTAGKNKNLRHRVPTEYLTSHAVGGTRTASTTPNSGPYVCGWFGNEIGRAVVRGLEVGIRQNTLLRRDADEMLAMLGRSTEIMLCDTRFPEEAGFLIDRIAEIGMFCLQIRDPVWDRWFEGAADRLAEIVRKPRLETAVCAPPHLRPEPEHTCADFKGDRPPACRRPIGARALAAWILVTRALSKEYPYIPRTDSLDGGPLSKDSLEKLWDHAKYLAAEDQMQPRWHIWQADNHKRQAQQARDVEKYISALRRNADQRAERLARLALIRPSSGSP